mmetsp:Transcript_83/g.193  ORF Transcript_83/g.193 Transcript_83/m.193 type:complete len:264 (-) Transcript_83:1449-2240(-)
MSRPFQRALAGKKWPRVEDGTGLEVHRRVARHGVRRGGGRLSLAGPCRALLSEEQKASYEAEGFLVLEDFASKQQVEELRGRGEDLVRAFDPETISIFSTKKQEKTMNGKVSGRAGRASAGSPFILCPFFERQTNQTQRYSKCASQAIFSQSLGWLNHWRWQVPQAFLGTEKKEFVPSSHICKLVRFHHAFTQTAAYNPTPFDEDFPRERTAPVGGVQGSDGQLCFCLAFLPRPTWTRDNTFSIARRTCPSFSRRGPLTTRES